MARFVDLDKDDDGGEALEPSSSGGPSTYQNMSTTTTAPPPACPAATTPSTTTTVCKAVTRAFQCYPIVFGVVSHIDLTTLDSLARSSRMIHHGLIQYRTALIASTLRCSNESVPVDTEQALRYRIARVALNSLNSDPHEYIEIPRDAGHARKTGRCARDMVAECRRCAAVICRNCAIKPPASTTLRERHRRLCAACAKAPLETVACPNLDMTLPLSADITRRSLCNCDEGGVWLCQPCGRTIRNADRDYLRIWHWRNHYGEVLGCLGTGIGDADRGVVCGREEHCMAARECEKETDCDAEDARGSTSSASSLSSRTPPSSNHYPAAASSHPGHRDSYFPAVLSSSPLDPHTMESLATEEAASRTPSPLLLGPGYERHEIVGIGGIVKRKLVRMVRVGKCVPEWEEERSSASLLGREARGEARSWCGWCLRVVPARNDVLPSSDELAH